MMDSVALVMLASYICPVLGFAGGAPNSCCTSMKPGHPGYEPQLVASPYTVDIGGVTTYTKGIPIKVKFVGVQYQGFFIQARKASGTDTTPIGSWSDIPENSLERTCSTQDDSLTHNSDANKEVTVFTWNPPQEDVGPIQFVATVAQNHDVYWMNNMSPQINHMPSTTTSSGSISGGGSESSTKQSPTTTKGGTGGDKSSEEPNAENNPDSSTGTKPTVFDLTVAFLTLGFVKYLVNP